MNFNIINTNTLDLLLSRRSAKARNLTQPGPSAKELELILKAGMRVPDHGKIFPWRFIVFEGEAQAGFGVIIAKCYRQETGDESNATVKGLQDFPCQAPVMITVAATPDADRAIPVWEQNLSAGAACQTMMIAATALGFGVNWLTGWTAYSPGVKRALGLQEKDGIAGFLFIGSHSEDLKERPRPSYDDIVHHWRTPDLANL